jgi:hypothetical protein
MVQLGGPAASQQSNRYCKAAMVHTALFAWVGVGFKGSRQHSRTSAYSDRKDMGRGVCGY